MIINHLISIPFLGMYLTDLKFIEMNSNWRRKDDGKIQLINFMKRVMYVKVIESIQQKQQKHYEFTPIPYLQTCLTQDIFKEPLLSEDEEWQLSNELEPN